MANTTSTATTLNGTITLNGSSNLTTTTGATLTYANGNVAWAERSHIDDVKDYIDFALELMGIDLDFQRFCRMTADEKKAMIREMKIDKIID